MIEIDPDLDPALMRLAWLLGTWEGVGVGGYGAAPGFRFGQELRIGHDGRAHLSYDSAAWRLDDAGRPAALVARETGWIRPRPEGVEMLLAHDSGIVEVWLGELDGARLELTTDAVLRTASARDVAAGHRLYGTVQGDLLWAYDMVASGQPLQSHVSARLRKVGPGPVLRAPEVAPEIVGELVGGRDGSAPGGDPGDGVQSSPTVDR